MPAANSPRSVDRVRALERDLAEHAGLLAGLAPRAAQLARLADHRAGPAPLRDFSTREWGRERAEEIADCFNYAAWDLLALTMRGDAAASAGRELLVVHASHLIRAFDASEQARELLDR